MAKEILLQPSGPGFRGDLDLPDGLFGVRLLYNASGDFYEMNIYKNGELKAAGQKLPKNAPMLRLFDDPDLPAGRFWVVDNSDVDADPGYGTVGDSVSLMYQEATNAPTE